MFGPRNRQSSFIKDGKKFADTYSDEVLGNDFTDKQPDNKLFAYFSAYEQGPGIWKWEHYFEMYDRHCGKFVDAKMNLLEIGIYSGGSLRMWREYFGEQSHIYGVDIEPACKEYEDENTTIFIGDQADREFWSVVKAECASFDLVIDDGGHTPKQQQVSIEELLPRVAPGGVYICEDIHGVGNEFIDYIMQYIARLNEQCIDKGRDLACTANSLQQAIHSIHFYPYAVVIEKRLTPIAKLKAPKNGTVWQPFRLRKG